MPDAEVACNAGRAYRLSLSSNQSSNSVSSMEILRGVAPYCGCHWHCQPGLIKLINTLWSASESNSNWAKKNRGLNWDKLTLVRTSLYELVSMTASLSNFVNPIVFCQPRNTQNPTLNLNRGGMLRSFGSTSALLSCPLCRCPFQHYHLSEVDTIELFTSWVSHRKCHFPSGVGFMLGKVWTTFKLLDRVSHRRFLTIPNSRSTQTQTRKGGALS